MANHLRASQSALAKSIFASSVSITVTAMLSVTTTTTTVSFICTNITLQKRGKYDNYGNLVISWELSRLTIRVARDPENKRREGEVVCALEGVRTRKLGPFLPPSKNCAILGL